MSKWGPHICGVKLTFNFQKFRKGSVSINPFDIDCGVKNGQGFGYGNDFGIKFSNGKGLGHGYDYKKIREYETGEVQDTGESEHT